MKKDEKYFGIGMMHVYVNHVSCNYLRLGLLLIWKSEFRIPVFLISSSEQFECLNLKTAQVSS